MPKTPDAPTLSIVIPAYNEANRIHRILQDIAGFRSLWPGPVEVILSDDGSQDDTVKVTRTIAGQLGLEPQLKVVAAPANRGKGHAVRSGMLEAQGDYVLFADADGATPMREALKLKAKLDEGYDVAIGSRDLPESNIVVKQPFYRRLMGAVLRGIVSMTVLGGFKDTQCGFKMFTASARQDIFPRQTLHGFSFDIEILYLARQLGYRVCEVPIEWHDQPGTKVKPIRSSLEVLRDLLIIRFRHWGISAARATKSEAARG